MCGIRVYVSLNFLPNALVGLYLALLSTANAGREGESEGNRGANAVEKEESREQVQSRLDSGHRGTHGYRGRRARLRILPLSGRTSAKRSAYQAGSRLPSTTHTFRADGDC
ncbi:hypothetical protein BDZ97DRAFT_1257084 [Flammula alnicola]|nr:hypothetical protein BDZ97DRAFT_1257084 [Flammula alnicola]